MEENNNATVGTEEVKEQGVLTEIKPKANNVGEKKGFFKKAGEWAKSKCEKHPVATKVVKIGTKVALVIGGIVVGFLVVNDYANKHYGEVETSEDASEGEDEAESESIEDYCPSDDDE